MEVCGVGDFDDCKTEGETVDRLIELTCQQTPEAFFTPADRDKLLELFGAVGEFINSCKRSVTSPGPGTRERHSQRQIELSSGNGFRRIGSR
jgi:hypothetical protein